MIKLVRIITFKVGRLPLGIWLAWLGIAYAAGAFVWKLTIFTRVANMRELPVQEAVATWLVIIIAAATLWRRRLITCIFSSMAMTLLFFHSMFHSDKLGMLIAALAVLALIPNRRWFDEKLPRID